jgi:hypothetical protein
MIRLFLIHCIIVLVQRSKRDLCAAAFRPVCPLSWPLVSRHGRDASLCDLKRWHRIRSDPRSFTLFLSLSSNDTEWNLHNIMLQKLMDPFDRWRFLQKLLDDDINDANYILFVLQATIQQRYQQQQSALNRMVSLQKSENLTTETVSPIAIHTDSAAAPLCVDDVEGNLEERLEVMNFILREKSSAVINRLLQAVESNSSSSSVHSLQDFRFLGQLERLLPHPEMDEDAFKGLWDTVIELHGRESVRINEQQNTMNWKTRCLIARVLIYYDFLSVGLRSTFETT